MQPAGPKFARKALDLVRAEKFKFDLRAKLPAAIAEHFVSTADTREQAVMRQVTVCYAALGRLLEQALDDVRAQRSRIQRGYLRRAAYDEGQRRSMETVDAELRGIHDRAVLSATQLRALQLNQ
jgi:hypothetical protein